MIFILKPGKGQCWQPPLLIRLWRQKLIKTITLLDLVVKQKSNHFFKTFIFIYLFIWLLQVLVAAHRIFDLPAVAHGVFSCSVQTLSCAMWDRVPWPGIKPSPLHWEGRLLATGPPSGKSLVQLHFWKILFLIDDWTLRMTHCNNNEFPLCFSADLIFLLKDN